jgi:hypothetical protein
MALVCRVQAKGLVSKAKTRCLKWLTVHPVPMSCYLGKGGEFERALDGRVGGLVYKSGQPVTHKLFSPLVCVDVMCV